MIHTTLIHTVDCLAVVGYRDPRVSCGFIEVHWYPRGSEYVFMGLADKLDERNWEMGYDSLFLNKENWDDGVKYLGEVFFPLEKYLYKIDNTR